MIRASFGAPARAQAPSASTASSTRPDRTGQVRAAGRVRGTAARCVVPTPRRTSAARATGSGVTTASARGCDRTVTRAVEPTGRALACAAAGLTAGATGLRCATTRGRGRTTRVSCRGALGARTAAADRTESPPAVVDGCGSATVASEGAGASGAAAAGLGGAADTDGGGAGAGPNGALGAAGAAAGAGAGAGGATGAATGGAGVAPRTGRYESGSR